MDCVVARADKENLLRRKKIFSPDSRELRDRIAGAKEIYSIDCCAPKSLTLN